MTPERGRAVNAAIQWEVSHGCIVRRTGMNATLLVQESRVSETPLLMIERFLRDREGIWQQIGQEYRLNALIRQMLTSSTIAFACYGVVIGLSHSLLQALSS